MAIAIFSVPSYGHPLQLKDGDEFIKIIHTPPHKSPRQQSVSVNYNQTTTLLDILFCAEQSGKVEIYRNGSLVACTKALAGASLSYVLSNYGKGDYAIIVSSGNTVVYSRSCIVK